MILESLAAAKTPQDSRRVSIWTPSLDMITDSLEVSIMIGEMFN